MGFYVQDDYWEAVKGLPVKAQTEILGALARYYFTDEEPKLSPAYQGIFIMGRQRVDMARNTADRKARSRLGQSRDMAETVTGQSRDNGVTLLLREGEGEKEKETIPKGIAKKEKSAAFKKPSLDDVSAYCAERKNGIDPQQFIDHYESNGWRVGKNPMKDWRAAVRTWERNRSSKEVKFSAESEFYAGLLDRS